MVDNPQVPIVDAAERDNIIRKASLAHARQDREDPDDYLWRLLQGGKLAGLHFRRNQTVEGFTAPFYCKLFSLVVEVDEKPGQKENPCKERERIFAFRGIRTLHIETGELLANPAAALQTIRRAAETPKSPAAPIVSRPTLAETGSGLREAR